MLAIIIGGALIWGVLAGLITHSVIIGVIVSVIAFFEKALTLGMCIAAVSEKGEK